MSSDLAVAKLVKLLTSKDERVVLAAAKDLADRANLAGTQQVEIGVTKRTFEDHASDMVMDLDVDEDDEDDLDDEYDDIVDAEVVEDEPPAETRHDRAAFREALAERRREHQALSKAKRGARLTEEQRASAARRASAGGPVDEPDRPDPWNAPDHNPEERMTREQLMLARERGDSTSSRGSGRTMSPKRRAQRNGG